MALFFADLVREASLGTGLGDLALDGALPGHRRFEDIVPPGARFHYAIAGVTHPQEWETGEGEIGSGGTLLRLPLDSSASGGAVDFSAGLKTVALTAGAAWFMAQEEGGAIGIADVEGLPAALAGKAALTGAAFTGSISAPGLGLTGDADAGGAYKIDGVKVVGNRVTGWGAPTGTASRAAFDTSAITAGQLAQRLKALIDDLRAHGLIGS
jgi:hypothetical protein